MKILNSEFLISAVDLNDLPDSDIPEVALIGRSNAGKSTLLNRLLNRRDLAKTSAKPGKTRTINFYKISFSLDGKKGALHLVDLPGYGYAQISKTTRFGLSKLVIDYLQNREQLDLVLFLSDCKRCLNTEDRDLYNFVFESGKNINIVLTKLDKLNQKQKAKSLKENAEFMNLESSDFYLTGTNQPITNLLDRISYLV